MKTKYILVAILTCIIWGTAFAFAKIGFEYVEPMRLSGMRFTLAGMLLWPVLVAKKIKISSFIQHWRFMLLFAFLQTFMQYGMFFMGLDKVPGATAAIIIGAGPLFVATMAHFLLDNDRMTLRKIFAILIGLAGVGFISLAKGEMMGNGSSFYIGVALLVFSNMVGGFTNIMVVKYKNSISPIALTSFANFTGGLMLFIVSLFIEGEKGLGYPFEFWAALIWLAIIPASCFSMWYTLLQKPGVKVSELNMWKFVIPIIGCVLSWLLLPNEYPDKSSLIGIMTITIALLIFQLPSARRTGIKGANSKDSTLLTINKEAHENKS